MILNSWLLSLTERVSVGKNARTDIGVLHDPENETRVLISPLVTSVCRTVETSTLFAL